MAFGSSDEEEESSRISSQSSPMQVQQLYPDYLLTDGSVHYPSLLDSCHIDAKLLFYNMQDDSMEDRKSPPERLTTAQQPLASAQASATYREEDIVLGRGAQYSQNPGNRRFYQAIDNGIPNYDAAKTKHEKSNVALSIFQSLSSENSRFVRKNEVDGTFIQIEDKDARQKISHALRYRKKNKSEPSLLSAAINKSKSDVDEESCNASFPRTRRIVALYDAEPPANNVLEVPATPNQMDASGDAQPADVVRMPERRGRMPGFGDSEAEQFLMRMPATRGGVTSTPSIFSNEDLDSVAPVGNPLPSDAASFHFYTQQDYCLGDEDRDESVNKMSFPW